MVHPANHTGKDWPCVLVGHDWSGINMATIARQASSRAARV